MQVKFLLLYGSTIPLLCLLQKSYRFLHFRVNMKRTLIFLNLLSPIFLSNFFQFLNFL